MSRLELQHAFFSVLPQLSEIQQTKLLDFINALLSIKGPQKETKTPLAKIRQVQVITDESFDYEQVETPAGLLSKNTFAATVKVGKVEKLKPTIILE